MNPFSFKKKKCFTLKRKRLKNFLSKKRLQERCFIPKEKQPFGKGLRPKVSFPEGFLSKKRLQI